MLSSLVEGQMCISLTMIFKRYRYRRLRNDDDLLKDSRRWFSWCVRGVIDRSSQKTSSLAGKG